MRDEFLQDLRFLAGEITYFSGELWQFFVSLPKCQNDVRLRGKFKGVLKLYNSFLTPH